MGNLLHFYFTTNKRITQLICAVFLNGYIAGFQKGKIFTGGSKAICVPVLNCYSCPGALGACPIGSLQTAIGGNRGHFPFYVLGLLMLFGVLLGRLACGLLCPFGLVQDLLHKIPVPKWKVPEKIDRHARYLKYVVLLGIVVILPVFAGETAGIPYFCKYICPAGTLGGGIPLMLKDASLRGLIGTLFQWKVLLLAVIMAASILISRPFCRYLCPLGAFYALFNKFSFTQMHLDEKKCVSCGSREQMCPMVVRVTENINHSECIRCGKCKAICATGAISYSVRPCSADAVKEQKAK